MDFGVFERDLGVVPTGRDEAGLAAGSAAARARKTE